MVKSTSSIRIYGSGLKNIKISNGLESGDVKVILSKTESKEIVIEKDKALEIDESGDVVKTPEVNKEALNAAIAKADAKEKEDYTVESWEEFQTALIAAKAMPEETQAEVDAKLASVEAAINKLVENSVTPEPEMVTVTFNGNGGNEIEAIKVEKGKTIELLVTPTRDGFTFVGWFTDDGTFENKFTGETPVTENITVYAKWEKIVENQVAPTEVKGLAPTTEENNDGKIIDVTTEMEYRLKGEENFIAVTGKEIIGLAAGKYEVRFKAKDGYNASPVTEVEVPAYVAKETILEAPENGAIVFNIKLEELDIKYLAFGLMNEANSAQKVATLEEVKSHLKTEYGVDFKSENIKLDKENGKISIEGKLLSTEDWNKIKEEDKKNQPYRITVLNGDKSNKLVKIAIYEDGKAVFHDTNNNVIEK